MKFSEVLGDSKMPILRLHTNFCLYMHMYRYRCIYIYHIKYNMYDILYVHVYSPETKITPENGWLDDETSFLEPCFLAGAMSV